jgi:hypothetical protein
MWTALLLLLACAEAPREKQGADGDSAAPNDDTGDIGGETPTQDRDSDGYAEDVDCDDTRAAIHPDADEAAWNGVDDNCDGRIDGDGRFAGELRLRATAIYEGDPYSFDLRCPATLDRQGARFGFSLLCSPDPDDDWAMLLLGESLWVEASSAALEADAWGGGAEVRSSNGWDTGADSSFRYVGLDDIALSAALSAVSLSLSVEGTLAWTGEPADPSALPAG